MHESGTYQLLERIGAGALASVHRVVDGEGRVFAGKQLHDSHAYDADARQRFQSEAQMAMGLRHANVVAVYGMVAIDGVETLLMELVEGPTLAAHLALEGPMSEAACVAIALGLAQGLGVAHAAGLVHRDLKPANVLLARENATFVAKIADFGMARAANLASESSDVLTAVGTPDYMAPECSEVLAVDARSDLYALGVIVYELLHGRPPFAAASPVALMERHREGEVSITPGLCSSALADLLHELLAKSPSRRPQSARAVGARLLEIQSGATVQGLPATLDQHSCRSCGEPMPLSMAHCLACATPALVLEPGSCHVLITGPGAIADKLDSRLRGQLCAWIDARPELGIDASELAKTIPRLPFALVGGVSAVCAERLARALRAIALFCEVSRASPRKHPLMRSKINRMSGRGMIAGAGGLGAIAGTSPWVMSAYFLVFVVLAGVAHQRSLRPVAKPAMLHEALPEALANALRRAASVAEGLERIRHRRALHGVVVRSLQLWQGPGVSADASEAAALELARGIDSAGQACVQLDALDDRLESQGPAQPTQGVRATLHRRDRWSARLLELTSSLESLQQRVRNLPAGEASDAERTRELDELRLQIEALEELAAL